MAEIIIEDVILDYEEIGLAENLVEVKESFTTVVGSDDEAESETIVYFGVDLPIGDIVEVKGKVVDCKEAGEGYAITIEVMALDDRYTEMTINFLKGKSGSKKDEGDHPLWALGLKQTNGAFATLVNVPAGLLNGDQLAKIAEITKQGAGVAKLTHAQRVILLLKPEQIETVSKDMESVGLRVGVLHHGIRNIRGCCGALCHLSQGTDALGLAIEVDNALFGLPMKFDVKIAISDCARNCMECFCVDIGLIAQEGTYAIFVGGAASAVHFQGIKLTESVTQKEVVPLIKRILEWYESQANKGERLYKVLERLGRQEAEKRQGDVIAKVSSAFEGVEMGYDVVQKLFRSLARGVGVNTMRTDLNLR
ncbi:hypothetical protein WDW89_11980 [Deltaproteobacteria bacterium TL4]